MRQDQIVIDTEYALNETADYNPRDYRSYDLTERVKTASQAKGGRVLVQYLDTGRVKYVNTRFIRATWAAHVEAKRLGQEALDAQKAAAAEERAKGANALVETARLLDAIGAESFTHALNRYGRQRFWHHDIAVELAELGFIVWADQGHWTDAEFEDILAEGGYDYFVLSPLNVASAYWTGQQVTPVTWDQLSKVFYTGFAAGLNQDTEAWKGLAE